MNKPSHKEIGFGSGEDGEVNIKEKEAEEFDSFSAGNSTSNVSQQKQLGIKKEISTIDYQDPNLTRTQINEKVNKNMNKLIVTTRTSKRNVMKGADSDD